MALKCEAVKRLLPAFLLGHLPDRQLYRIASHLGKCQHCFSESEALRSVIAGLERRSAESGQLAAASEMTGITSHRLARLSTVRRFRLVFAVACMLVVGVLTPALVLPRQMSISVMSVIGTPQWRGSAWSRWRTLSSGIAAGRAIEIRSTDTDRAEVQLGDGSRVLVDFSTTARIVGPSIIPRKHRHRVELATGRLWVLVTPQREGLVIRTPSATAETLGTLFEISADSALSKRGPRPEPSTSVSVLRGKVKLANRQGTMVCPEGAHTEATISSAPRQPNKIAYYQVLRGKAPWGQTGYEVWLPERVRMPNALTMIAADRKSLGVTAFQSGSSVVVKDVQAGFPAYDSGIRPGDRLLRVGSVRVRRLADLTRAEMLIDARQPQTASIVRDGRTMDVQMHLRPRPLSDELESADSLFAAGRFAEAGGLYERLSASNAAARNNAGVVHELLGQTAEAIRDYHQAVRRDPEHGLFQYNLAMALSRIGNFDAAAAVLKELVARSPTYPRAAYQLGKLYAFKGDTDQAKAMAAAMKRQQATRAQGYCLAGEIHRFQRQFGGAASEYLRAVGCDPLYPDPRIYLGATYFCTGDLDRALLWTESALELDPDSLPALVRKGLILYRLGRLHDAEHALARTAVLYPDSAETSTDLAMIYLKQGRVSESVKEYQKATSLAPNAVYAHVGLAVALERGNDSDGAEREYRLAVRIDPTCRDTYSRLIALYERLGRTQLAKAAREQARAYGA